MDPTLRPSWYPTKTLMRDIGWDLSLLARAPSQYLASTRLGTYLSTTRPVKMLASVTPTFILKSFKTNFDPEPAQEKPGKTINFLMHGLGANESILFDLRKALENDSELGSAFSMNLDGLLKNDPNMRLQDYADKVVQRLVEISQKTGIIKFNLVGHSMGGLVGALVREKAEKEGIEIEHFITIDTPWQTAPKMKSLTGIIFDPKAKHIQQMLNIGGALTKLRNRTIKKFGNRCGCIYSKGDWRVEGKCGRLNIDSSRIVELTDEGHNTVLGAKKTIDAVKRMLKAHWGR